MTASRSPDPPPDLAIIDQLVMHYRGAHALMAGVSLGVFDALAQGPRSAQHVARSIKAPHRSTQVLLDALAALGLLQKNQLGYSNTPVADHYLRSDSPRSLSDNLRYQQLLAQSWAELPQIIRDGAPDGSLPMLLSQNPNFVERYTRGVASISARPARELAQGLDLTHIRQVLDVGGGAAVYAKALLDRSPGTQVVVLDLGPTLEITRRILGTRVSSPASPRTIANAGEDTRAPGPPHAIELREGDYHTADFGREAFDLVLFSHVLHDEGEEDAKSLLHKAFTALRPSGQVVIHDFMPSSSRTEPLFHALFSLHLLTYTQKGRAYCADEYEAWLGECGFVEPQRKAICADRPTATTAIIATKP